MLAVQGSDQEDTRFNMTFVMLTLVSSSSFQQIDGMGIYSKPAISSSNRTLGWLNMAE